MRPFVLPFFCAAVIAAIGCAASAPSALYTTDLGEGVFARDPEFDFGGQLTAGRQLFAILEGTPEGARHLRAIRFYHQKCTGMGEAVPRLRELVSDLRGSRRPQAEVEMAFAIGLLLEADESANRALYLKDLAPLAGSIRRNLPSDPWARLVAAMLFATLPELQGNGFDEALYAQCYGYDDAAAQLASGSYLLALDLKYGGNERLQWFSCLAFKRALVLAPENLSLRARIEKLIEENLTVPGYKQTRWLKEALAAAAF